MIAGAVTPFDRRLRIDTPALARHLRSLADGGVSAVVVNADTGEGQHLDREERRDVLGVAVREIGARVSVLTGLVASSTREAIEAAGEAEMCGAAGLQVFPPLASLGGPPDPELAAAYYEAIAEATVLPLVVYRPPLGFGYGFDATVLARVVEVPAVAAVKESSFDRAAYAETLELLGPERSRVKLLSGADTFVLESLRLGADGAMLALAAVAPERWVELLRLHRGGLDQEADEAAARLEPLVAAIFAPPFRNFPARLKEALVLLGELDSAAVRPPLLPLDAADRERVARALEAALFVPARADE